MLGWPSRLLHAPKGMKRIGVRNGKQYPQMFSWKGHDFAPITLRTARRRTKKSPADIALASDSGCKLLLKINPYRCFKTGQ
eukprot:5014209-Amphidinium_carterae.1